MSSRLTLTVGLCVFALLSSQHGPAQQTSDSSKRAKSSKTDEEDVQPSRSKTSSKSTPKPKPKASPVPAKPVPKAAPAPVKAVPSKPPVKDTPEKDAPSKDTKDLPPKGAEKPASTPRGKESPAPAPSSKRTQAPEETSLVIEKSGFDSNAGYQPPAFFGWFSRWKYLSKSVREQIDKAPVKKGRWRYIVVHNSGTRQGNAKAFEYYHTKVRKMSNGLAYQFVIGNGTSSGDGEIEIGSRWRRQINGGHVHSDYLNNIALGICLVGDFNQDKPTQKQLAALDELIRYLRQRVGKIDDRWAIVKAHREINPPRWPTDCPGNDFPYAWLHNRYD